jgi:hypothetical protein
MSRAVASEWIDAPFVRAASARRRFKTSVILSLSSIFPLILAPIP